MAKNDNFFTSQKAGSEIKTTLVLKYFKDWGRIMCNQVRSKEKPRICYVDLYSGPGRYDDGNGKTVTSTAIRVLEHAVATPDLCNMLVSLFNDVKPAHTKELQRNIDAIPGIKGLKYQPQVRTGEVDAELVKQFADVNLVPTFSFIDPFGFKGLTLDLIQALVKSWGCDMVLFFNFNQINRFLTTTAVKKHIDALYGPERAEGLRNACTLVESEAREELLIEKYIEALNGLGYDYVIPYVVDFEDKDRTSHYLIFVSKSPLGFKIMKSIMYSMSEEKTQGVARFGFVRSVTRKKTPILDLFNRPLDELGDQICEDYAGRTLTRKRLMELYDQTHVRNRFVDKNWRDVLTKLEDQGRITADPVKADRRPYKGAPSFSDRVEIRFPPRKKDKK